MSVRAPHFLLFSESRRASQESAPSTWRFVLEAVDGEQTIEAVEPEPETHGERLELLAVVRGLEALDQPSRVTLVTPSRYVARGLRYGLEEWRGNAWQWERFGKRVPIKNGDLWRRVDRAMQFHDVECRCWRFDSPEIGDVAGDAPFEMKAAPKKRRSTSMIERIVNLARRSIPARRQTCPPAG